MAKIWKRVQLRVWDLEGIMVVRGQARDYVVGRVVIQMDVEYLTF